MLNTPLDKSPDVVMSPFTPSKPNSVGVDVSPCECCKQKHGAPRDRYESIACKFLEHFLHIARVALPRFIVGGGGGMIGVSICQEGFLGLRFPDLQSV